MSENSRDAWVAGYDPNLVVVVWVGGGGQKPLQTLDPTLRLWGDIAREALKLRLPEPFAVPSDVVDLSLCKNAGCSSRVSEYVLRGTEKAAQDANASAVARSPRISVDSRTPLVGRDQTSDQSSAVPSVSTVGPVAAGPTILVPDIVGASLDQGRVRLIAAGLRVAADLRYVSGAEIPRGTPAVAVGQVVSTTPAAGSQVPAGTEITVVVRRN